jgi:fatty-acyl-CoA synthase
MFVYIGELGRYIVNQPEHPLERAQAQAGVRQRPAARRLADLPRPLQDPEVLEFYGATEGNVSIFNFDGKRGACGRVPRYLKRKFPSASCSSTSTAEQPVRTASGPLRRGRPPARSASASA